MNPAETSYTIRLPYPDMLQVGRTCLVKAPVYTAGALAAPTVSGSTYSLVAPDGTYIVDHAAVTVSGSIAQYSITGATIPATLTLGEGYQSLWVLVMADGTTRTIDHPAALIRRPLYPVVTDADLEAVYPDLSSWRGSAIASMQGWIDEAWKQILGRLIEEGHLPYLIKDAWAFRGAHIELTLACWARYASKGRAGSNFLELAAQHQGNYDRAWGRINFRVDADQSGAPDSNTERAAQGAYRLTARGGP